MCHPSHTVASTGLCQCAFVSLRFGDEASSNSQGSLFEAALFSQWTFCFLKSKLNTSLGSCTFCYHREEFGSGAIVAPHHKFTGCCELDSLQFLDILLEAGSQNCADFPIRFNSTLRNKNMRKWSFTWNNLEDDFELMMFLWRWL